MSATTQPRTLAGTTWRVGVATLLWFLLGVTMVNVVPKFLREFREYGMTLPSSTQIVIDVSMWVADYWWIAGPLMLPVIAFAALITYLVRHRTDNRPLMAIWTLLLLAPPIMCHAGLWLNLVLAHMKLAEGLR
jgi:type II secretory pathway component PulF